MIDSSPVRLLQIILYGVCFLVHIIIMAGLLKEKTKDIHKERCCVFVFTSLAALLGLLANAIFIFGDPVWRFDIGSIFVSLSAQSLISGFCFLLFQWVRAVHIHDHTQLRMRRIILGCTILFTWLYSIALQTAISLTRREGGIAIDLILYDAIVIGLEVLVLGLIFFIYGLVILVRLRRHMYAKRTALARRISNTMILFGVSIFVSIIYQLATANLIASTDPTIMVAKEYVGFFIMLWFFIIFAAVARGRRVWRWIGKNVLNLDVASTSPSPSSPSPSSSPQTSNKEGGRRESRASSLCASAGSSSADELSSPALSSSSCREDTVTINVTTSTTEFNKEEEEV
eukprot:TRINITY_DN1728_c0_g1_i1.p1 TRINITY_DN1728_c0_g1~~TRINITY_DN1728_c0_g1_i1.p1  ORF type:complete len:377 (-),score=52.66 TRINITY_DN1728_c0_g1_i1:39-1067(-)